MPSVTIRREYELKPGELTLHTIQVIVPIPAVTPTTRVYDAHRTHPRIIQPTLSSPTPELGRTARGHQSIVKSPASDCDRAKELKSFVSLTITHWRIITRYNPRTMVRDT